MSQINDKLLFKSDKYALILNNDDLMFFIDDEEYHLTCQPYEPCLYISKDDKIIRIIHNSFTTDEIISSAQNGLKISAITGKGYDINTICEVITLAINLAIYEADLGYLENQLIQGHIVELTDDLFYNEFNKYDACVLDYCIVKINDEYQHEKSHQEAVLFAMKKWQAYLKREFDLNISIDEAKMKATKISTKDFFLASSSSDSKETESYFEMFLNPPHGTTYTAKEFDKINQMLFPNGFDELEIYDWSTDWSNYFDDGHEWWGARCVSIFDKSLDRFVVIGASATD